MGVIDEIIRDLQAIPIEQGTMMLTPAAFNLPVMTAWFAKVVQADQLVVTHAQLTTTDASATVTGTSDVLGYTGLSVTLTFAEEGDETVVNGDDDIIITLSGAFSSRDLFPLPVVSWIALYDRRMVVRFQSRYEIVETRYQGQAGPVPDTTPPVRLTLGFSQVGATRWQLSAAGDDRPSLTLAQLAAILGVPSLESFLPQTLINLLEGIAFDGMSAVFDTEPARISYFSVGISAVNGWPVIPGVVEIKPGVALSLTLVDPTRSNLRQTIGMLTGTFALGGVDIPAFVQAAVGGAWFIGVQPGRQVVLPSLSNLLSLAGGEDFLRSLPSGFSDIPTIVINRLELGFNPSLGTLDNVGFSVSTGSSWQVIPGYFAITSLSAAMGLANVLDPAKRTTAVTLAGVFQIGKTPVQCSLKKPATSNEWILTGSLPPGGSINLTDTAARLLPGVTIPENAPQLVFTELSLSVNTLGSALSFSAGSTTPWKIYSDFAVTSFRLAFASTGRGVKGTIQGQLQLGSVDLKLSADLNNTPDGGWRFAGNTGAGQQIPIGTLIGNIAQSFGVDTAVPAPIAGLTLQNLSVTFETKTLDFTFHGEATLPISGQNVGITVEIALRHGSDGSYRKTFGGHIDIGQYEFGLVFSADAAASTFLATYHDGGGAPVEVKSLIESLSPSLAQVVPEGLRFGLYDAVFAYHGGAFLFGLDMEMGINLSNLPLIGQALPSDETIRLTYQVLLASDAFSRETLELLNRLMPPASKPLPAPAEGLLGSKLILSTRIFLGDAPPVMLELPIDIGSSGKIEVKTPAQPLALSTEAVGAAQSEIKWINLQKQFGPVHFDKIGGRLDGSDITFLLSAGLALQGLSISLDGLSVTSPLTELRPVFGLLGIAVELREGALSVSGAFLRRQATEGGKSYDVYNGLALVRLPQLQIAALGSYARLNGAPSLFVYGVLDAPLGGPAFFFVEGLAAGFGYNRNLIAPGIDEVATFPLVAAATTGVDKITEDDLTRMLDSLQRYVPPSVGSDFVALGIKFNSFRLIDAFALALVLVGERFEINVLGLATAIIPTPDAGKVVPPIAEVQLALKARFAPAEGFIGVQGQLTPASYLLSKNCRLTGGFAAFAWFSGEHAGDFVLTLGGYHPDFVPPAHYPRVPRLGFNWRITEELSIKGGIYFALTPSLLMAGGRLEATWESGSLRAWFKADANLLLGWKPYHYSADMMVNVGASYTFKLFGRRTISFEVGAGLEIWGPDFSGRVHINYYVVSFTVEFGAARPGAPPPISWTMFKQSFLPDAAEVVGASAAAGLLRGGDGAELGVLDPRSLAIRTNSMIPVNALSAGGTTVPAGSARTAFGIRSMGVAAQDLNCTQAIRITGPDKRSAEEKFDFVPVTKTMPAALWGEPTKQDKKKSVRAALEAPATVPNLLAGVEIRPKQSANPASTAALDADKLRLDVAERPGAFEWGTSISTKANDEAGAQRRSEIADTITETSRVKARRTLLAAFGVDAESIDVAPSLATVFREPPRIPTSGSQPEPAQPELFEVEGQPPPGAAWPWQVIPLRLAGNTRVTLTYRGGRWTARAEAGLFTAAGNPRVPGGDAFLVPSASESELVGALRGSDGRLLESFRVGERYSFSVPSDFTGDLLLTINDRFGARYDEGAKDNAGRVTVKIVRGPAA